MKKKESDLRINSAIPKEKDSSLEELEQFSYAEFLEEESEITMDFTFEDLMEKVEEKKSEIKPQHAKIIKFNQNVILKYVGGIAACGLLILGSFYALQQNEGVDQHAKTIEVVQHQLKTAQLPKEIVPAKEEVKELEHENTIASTYPKENKKKTKSTQILPINKESQTINKIENVVSPNELVVMNGEVIEDEAKAEEIALNALKLLAQNLHKGNEAVGQLKHLSIEL